MVDRGLVAAAAGLAGATMFGAYDSARENISGEPLGQRLPGHVPVHLRLGLGSGLSVPWPMPVAAMVAALQSRPQTSPGRVCAAVGAGVLGGTMVEPGADLRWPQLGRRYGGRGNRHPGGSVPAVGVSSALETTGRVAVGNTMATPATGGVARRWCCADRRPGPLAMVATTRLKNLRGFPTRLLQPRRWASARPGDRRPHPSQRSHHRVAVRHTR